MSKPAESSEFIQRDAGLTVIPSKVVNCINLVHLDLACNAIQVVPKSFFPNLTTLQFIDFSDNQIAALPSDISSLSKLEVLRINNNNLTRLPGTLCQVTTLQQLHAANNQLMELPIRCFLWEKLTLLEVSGNALTVLPPELGWLPNIQELNIHNNPDLRVPQIVLQHGLRGLISYLQVVGEQHRLVERHMYKFVNHKKMTNNPSQQGLSVEQRIEQALGMVSSTGVLNLRAMRLNSLPTEAEKLQLVHVLNLSHNQLVELGSNIMDLPGLVVMDLSHNQLQRITARFSTSMLAVLNLSFNKLRQLPPIPPDSKLQQLYVVNNLLEDLPSSLTSARMVDVFASENLFTHVPNCLLQMKLLSKLSLACCQLVELPEDIDGLASLVFLDVSFNLLQDLPQNMGRITSLTALNASFNPLKVFPDCITRLCSLTELNLDYTEITQVPDGIGALTQLQGLQMEGVDLPAPYCQLFQHDPLLAVAINDSSRTALDLSGLGLTAFPTQLACLTNLTSLNLQNNLIKEVPVELGMLTNLKHLELRNNPLVPPFSTIIETQGAMAILPMMNTLHEKLDLSSCGLECVPSGLIKLHQKTLIQLKLTNNKLRELSSDLTSCSQLTSLLVDGNYLSQLPTEVLQTPKLAVLMASENKLTALPENLGDFTQLQALMLSYNHIPTLPTSIGNLYDLRALSLDSNRLSHVPKELGQCTRLRMLDLSQNKIIRLPTSLGNLQKLRIFKASQNLLTHIPKTMCRGLTALSDLHLDGNHIRVPFRLSATDQGAVHNLLRMLEPLAPEELPDSAPHVTATAPEPAMLRPDPSPSTSEYINRTSSMPPEITQLAADLKSKMAVDYQQPPPVALAPHIIPSSPIQGSPRLPEDTVPPQQMYTQPPAVQPAVQPTVQMVQQYPPEVQLVQQYQPEVQPVDPAAVHPDMQVQAMVSMPGGDQIAVINNPAFVPVVEPMQPVATSSVQEDSKGMPAPLERHDSAAHMLPVSEPSELHLDQSLSEQTPQSDTAIDPSELDPETDQSDSMYKKQPGAWGKLQGQFPTPPPRPKSGWDSIQLLDAPKIIAAVLGGNVEQPSRAAASSSADGQQSEAVTPMRPQTRARFKRVMQQTHAAMMLLQRTLELQNEDSKDAAGDAIEMQPV